MTPSKIDNSFVITRVFNASRERIWSAWTHPNQLQQWMGPEGTTGTSSKIDLRIGGMYHYGLKTQSGVEFWGKWIFREIVKPQRLVVMQSFSDKEGGVTRHPLSPTWPLEMLTTVTFTEQNDRTTVTLIWTPYNPTDEEQRRFEAGMEEMTEGWRGTFNKLEEFLAKSQ